MNIDATGLPSYFERFVDKEWLARRREDAIDPWRPIIDPHHHIWSLPLAHYPAEELLLDLTHGHNVRATVYLESRVHWRSTGPEHLRSVGETEYVTEIAEKYAGRDGPSIAAGIVGHVDFEMGSAIQEVLEAHIAAGRGRFKGVRANLFWDADVDMGYPMPPRNLSERANFRAGFSRLATLGLSCDIMAYYPNLPTVAELLRAFPGTHIVINHCGGPMGCPPYQHKQLEMIADWRRNIGLLASLPNVHMKIGGLGGPFFGPLIPMRLRAQAGPPSSESLAQMIEPFVYECVLAFGPQRCMFESNFPADKYDYDYVVLWNAFKRLTHHYSASEQHDLFAGTAARFYRIAL
jgi:L-fuconolactonase